MIRVFSIDDVIVNVDNNDDADRLLADGAQEINAATFGEYAQWADSENTKFNGSIWEFTPPLALITQRKEEGEEHELDEVLIKAIGDNPSDKISKLQSMNPSDGSVAKRYLTKLLSQQSDAEAELTSFI